MMAAAAAANAEEDNFSTHLLDKVASSPVYLADKNEGGKGNGHDNNGKGGDHKHGNENGGDGSSDGGSSSGSSGNEGNSGDGDTATTNSDSGGSNNNSSEGDGAADSQEYEEETPASDDEDDNDGDSSSDSQGIPVAYEVQQKDDEQAESLPLEEEESYPEDTYPDSYFSDRPLRKMELQRYLILDEEGNVVSSAKPGDSIKIAASYKNLQQKEQRYALITQIVDQDGVTLDVGWAIDVVESGGYVDWFKVWKPNGPAVCTIKTIVWSGVGENPVPLSDTNVMAVVVQ
ncbi:hypothetical protein NWT39_10115 [Nitrososphaera viennensis]|uniref:Uncharacterized protein n=1 Tax=Nitrososphaera viennensis TaxID=1034015 RepID=A0A977NLA7_9ARCH|nr:hypothetical protein [Nitrososphaera viennensis]UVS68252.1 hypothetical protein NWT39_10115 [Nitrososphaera viennensis]